ncbi:hypothetical protein U1Q18_029544, partial [Sarracenia purpurea var. burkii]
GIERDYQYGLLLRAVTTQKNSRNTESKSKPNSNSAEEGSTGKSGRRRDRNSDEVNPGPTSGSPSEAESTPNLETSCLPEKRMETKSVNSENFEKEFVTGEKDLTMTTGDISKAIFDKGRIPDLRHDCGESGYLLVDQGGGPQRTNDVLRVDLGISKPNVALGLLNKSTREDLLKDTTQRFDPVKENSSQPVLGYDRASYESLLTRAQNWKRRAREAKGNSGQVPRNGGERKRKMEIEGGNENNDEMEQEERRKKFRKGTSQTGTSLNSESVEAESQPHRAP